MTNIAFFGTSTFAYNVLKKIHKICLEKKYKLSFIVSKPDDISWRSRKILVSYIKNFAKQKRITILQPKKLRNSHIDGKNFLDFFISKHIDLAIVVAYGNIIPKCFLNNAKFGFINIHTSLLPRWRGAAPIQRAIEAGDTQTGITYVKVTSKLDAGDIYSTYNLDLNLNDDSLLLSKKLIKLINNSIEKIIMGILSNTISSIPQSCYGITYANKLKKHEGLINWNQSYKNIYNKIKAFNPWPGSFTYYNGKLLKLFEPKLSLFQVSKDILPGTIIYIGNELIIACNDACISFGIVQIQGKKPINMNKLLNSNFFNKNDCFNVVLD